MNMNKVGKEKTAAAELIVGNKETETHKTSHMDQFSSRRQFDREEQGQKSEKWLCVHWKKGKERQKMSRNLLKTICPLCPSSSSVNFLFIFLLFSVFKGSFVLWWGDVVWSVVACRRACCGSSFLVHFFFIHADKMLFLLFLSFLSGGNFFQIYLMLLCMTWFVAMNVLKEEKMCTLARPFEE